MAARATKRATARATELLSSAHRYSSGLVLVLTTLLAGCGEESPTEVGGSLLPGQIVRTFEVVLDPAAFLVRDTSFSGYTRTAQANYFVLANGFENTWHARGLVRFLIPSSITVLDSAGVSRVDTLPRFFAGRIVVLVDSLPDTFTPVTVEAHRATQSWDRGSTGWTLRVDSGGVQLPWAQAGGSPGVRIGTGSYVAGRDTVAGVDSVVIPVDSQTIAAWRDTANNVPGAVVTLATAGTRLRVSQALTLLAEARSSIRADTVVTVTVGQSDPIFIANPSPPEAALQPRMGGVPSWRTFVQFRERLDTVTVPCPDRPAGCRIRLDSTAISYAALLLKPARPPAGFLPEDSVRFLARLAVVDALIPLKRSILAGFAAVDRFGGPALTRPLVPALFRNPVGAEIEVPITDFINLMTRDSAAVSDRPDPYLVLLSIDRETGSESATVGYGMFDSPFRLRLVLTVAAELQLR